MWVGRETVRLLLRIGIAVLIAIVIAEVRTLIGGGDVNSTFRIILLLLGGLYLLLGAAGTGSAASRRVNWTVITWWGDRPMYRAIRPKPEDPTVSPGAMFIGSGIVLLVLGAVL